MPVKQIALTPPPAPGGTPLSGPELKAASAILVDAATGTVLWEKDPHTRRPIASTTKIMTGTLMIESGRLDDVVTFSEKARYTPYANLNAKPGEQFPMRELLYAVMLRSSNDGCVAVAEHLSGQAWKFASKMTARARQLGALNTNFVSVNGLYDKNHYSTAYDLALMTRYAIQFPLFNEVVGTHEKTITRSANQKDTLVRNHNKFLQKYQGADGIKTGYVRQSGRCLVASATGLEGGQPWRLITVVLNSDDTYGDSARMMDWGRKNFQPLFIAHKGDQIGVASVHGGTVSRVPLVAANDLTAIVRRAPGNNHAEREIRVQNGLRAPIEEAQLGGRLVAVVDGQPVSQVDLLTTRPVTQVWTASVAPFTGWSFTLALLVLGTRYVRSTAAKSARRRRRRLATRSRNPDLEWESDGQW
jgi:D-alanyl-D-alanine carboxypeptidase (penicillin-binding protein 5/6)